MQEMEEGRHIKNQNRFLVFLFLLLYSICVYSQNKRIEIRVCNTTDSIKKLPINFTNPCLNDIKRNESWSSDSLEIEYILEKAEYLNIRSSREVDLSKLGFYELRYSTLVAGECKKYVFKKIKSKCFEKYFYPTFIHFKIGSKFIILEKRLNNDFYIIEGDW